jgi:hypothetical protein
MASGSPGTGKGWPPLVATGIAFALVFLVLPNPLRVPQNNPTASAEYAPVPGNQSSAQNANFSQTNSADSAGLGSGGEGSGALPGKLPPPPPPQFRPKQKLCYGNPPRQTPDPLSPPCVGYFDGDNGGSTWHGVTKDEIKVAFYNVLDVNGDMNRPWQPSDEHACTTGYDCQNLVRTIKAQIRYFQSHYQTYGRNVHFIAKGTNDATCAGQLGKADETKIEIDPFATVFLGDNNECYEKHLATEYKIINFGANFDTRQDFYDSAAPYIWGFFPSQEVEVNWSSQYVCNVLKKGNGKARFSTDPTMRNKTRKFGFIHPTKADNPAYDRVSGLFLKQLADCGIHPKQATFNYQTGVSGPGAQEAPGVMTSFSQAGITTILCMCPPNPTQAFQNAAVGIDYFPEWYFDSTSAMDRPIWQQTYSNPQQRGIGVTYFWNEPEFTAQYPYKSYSEIEPGTQPNVRWNFNLYTVLLNLFQGIQAAGPELTPETIERGMFTFNYLNRSDTGEPTGGYGQYNSKARSDYTFVDTAMSWWFDPKGTPPGGRKNEGCIRPMNRAKRYYAEEWPVGDDDLYRSMYTSPDPCSEDTRKLEDPAHAAGP